jgi:hypothetical protein
LTLAASLAFLAVHQDIQDEILEHILTVIGPDRETVSDFLSHLYTFHVTNQFMETFEDYPKLNKVLAVFLEAIRMFRMQPLLALECYFK